MPWKYHGEAMKIQGKFSWSMNFLHIYRIFTGNDLLQSMKFFGHEIYGFLNTFEKAMKCHFPGYFMASRSLYSIFHGSWILKFSWHWDHENTERVLNDFNLWVSGQKLTFFEELEQVWERFKTTHFLKQLWSAW